MARIQLRRDTTVNWLAADPVLAEGEQGLDTSTGFLYIGDGSTPISTLPPFTGDNTAVYTKTETDAKLALKADIATTYTKTETATEINSATLPLGQGSDVTLTSPANDQVLAYNGSTANWENKTIYANVAYNTEDDAKAAGKFEGDVYYNNSFNKTLIIGAPQIPGKKTAGGASSLEVYYDTSDNKVTVKDVISTTELKNIAAASTDFADFQARIANL